MTPPWSIARLSGSAAALHGRAWPEPLERTAWVCEVARPALVVGSAQRVETVDAAAAADLGVEVVRRRSGGGAVLLLPGEALWLDVFVPAGDALWRDDVGRAFVWLGRVWADALRDHTGRPAVVRDGPGDPGPLGATVCFAGLGTGEVSVGGAKAVGLSQRRTRAGARFQCIVHGRWRTDWYERLLAPGLGGSGELERRLAAVDVFPVDDLEGLTARVIDRLP